jgi:hypothetical protein
MMTCGELYDGNVDWTQANDLSNELPEKLHELQRLWLIEAVKYNVLPLDDRQAERFIPEVAGRPTLIKGNSQMLFAGMGRLSENSVVDIKNKSWAVTAELEVPADGAEGVVIVQGGRLAGTGRVDQTQGVVFSADETTDVGRETGTVVSPDYTAHTSKFTGKINWVRIDLGDDAKDVDHYIDSDELFRVAMARQ